MDTQTVTDISTDEDSSPSHPVTDNVPGIPLDDEFACVHGVAQGILGIASNKNLRPIHERPRIGTNYPLHIQAHAVAKAAGKVSLALGIKEEEAPMSLAYPLPKGLIRLAMVKSAQINFQDAVFHRAFPDVTWQEEMKARNHPGGEHA